MLIKERFHIHAEVYTATLNLKPAVVSLIRRQNHDSQVPFSNVRDKQSSTSLKSHFILSCLGKSKSTRALHCRLAFANKFSRINYFRLIEHMILLA